MSEIAIVSEGKEIAYAKTLADLFKSLVDDNVVFSSRGETVNVEMYSTQVFLRSSVPKKTFKVAIGSTNIKAPETKTIIDEDGVLLLVGDKYARFCVDEAVVDARYDSLFKKLSALEKEYFELEANYVKLVKRQESKYIESNRSLFKKSSNIRTIQAYLYLAYHFYLNELNNLIA